MAYKPAGLSTVPEDLVFDPSYRVIPYDYGYFAIIYDSEKISLPRGVLKTSPSLNSRKPSSLWTRGPQAWGSAFSSGR
jgi:thiamine transport system substrate-binding protein